MTKKNQEDYVIKIEKLPRSEVKISFKIPAKEFEIFIHQTVDELAKDMKVDGFRAGKAPRNVVEQNIGSHKLLHESAERAVKKTYVSAILNKKIEAVGEPKIEITKLAPGNDFDFSANVGVLPKISFGKWEDDVKKVNKQYKDKKIEIDEKEVDREISFLANQRAKVVTVNREARKGDQVELDFDVFKDNVKLENGSAKGQHIILGEGKFIPGFEQQLEGQKAGDEKEFELAFPKTYHAKHLAGQTAQFKSKIKLVQERQVAKIDDEFAKSIGKFKNLEELKNNIREGVEHEKKHKQDDEQKNKIIEVLIKKTEMEAPAVLVEREIQTMSAELEQDLARMNIDKKKYFELQKTSEEKLMEQWREKEAPKRIKAALILRQLAKDNKIKVDSKEIEQQVNKIMQYHSTLGTPKEKIDIERLYDSTKGTLTNEKVFKHLMSI